MIVPVIPKPGDPARHLLFVTTPALWPAWPFFPVVRQTGGGAELGVLFDARGVCDLTGFGATVFLCSVFDLPPTLDRLFALPKEVFDAGEEMIRAGWRVD